MLTVKGHNPIIKNILRIKGVPFTEENSEKFGIETREFELNDFNTIIHYLDERFPIPQIISGDVENRARLREIAAVLLKDPKTCDRLAKEANPFIFGPHITLVDLVVAENTNHTPYKQFISQVINGTADEGW